MGCQSSKEMDRLSHLQKQQKQQQEDDHAEAVSRCKQRKELVKHVSEARSAFSTAHTAYLRALTMVGNSLHALRLEQQRRLRAMALQYTPADAQTVVMSPPAGFVLSSPPSEVCNGTVIRPPPPPPGLVTWDFGIFDQPDIFVPFESESEKQSGSSGREAAPKEPEAEDEEDDMVFEIEGGEVKVKETVVLHHKYRVGGDDLKKDSDGGEMATTKEATAAAASASRTEQQEQEEPLAMVAVVRPSAADVLRMVSDEFLKAAASGAGVTRMLEAGSGLENTTGLGLLGDPSRLKALSWRRNEEETDQLVGDDIAWSHALTLERLCAWELKLYEEVKAVDAITVEFNKKRKLLAKLSTHSEVDDASIEYTRAEIKAIETQMSVAIQAMEATAAAVQKIINEELHYQLVELLEGLTDMWRVMVECHDYQRRLVADLQFAEDEGGLEPVSTSQRDATQQLETALVAWQGSLKSMISTEEDYIRSLTLWLAASIPKANQKKQQITRRQARLIRLALPEIYFLCQEWEKSLADIPKDPACASIRMFSQTVSRIKLHQTEELKVQKKLECLLRDLSKAERKLAEGGGRKKDAVDMLKNQVKDEEARLKQLARGSRRFASDSAPDGLRCLLENVSRFCATCLERHQELHSKAKQGIKLDVVK